MKTIDFKGSFYNISEWIMRLLITNILWIFFNLPIIYIAINLIAIESLNEFIMILITIGILSPFVFFPATIAMFAVIRKWVMKETDFSIISFFWYSYKENYVRSMLVGFVLEVLWFFYFIDYYFFITFLSDSFNSSLLFLLSLIFLLLFLFLFVFSLHFISYTIHFNAKIYVSMKDSMLITIGNPLISISVGGLNGFILYVSFYLFTFLIPFFMGSIIALVSFSGFYLIFLKVQSLQENK